MAGYRVKVTIIYLDISYENISNKPSVSRNSYATLSELTLGLLLVLLS
jgi:hypothetical protein